jgi:alkanesulfonate monooxygenase SsuD/methylene tetrahydromethanopterin reductase-like flavin-dependent oxidoreductase (luciferase family)
MELTASQQAGPARLVRVWFGLHVIASHTDTEAAAARYEAAMRRRFASCRVTNDRVPAALAGGG